ncbi:ligand-gated ion channel [Ferruginibacter sp.]
MKRIFLLTVLGILFSFAACFKAAAEGSVPDTVSTGIYVNSIHDIDFKQKEYTVNCWVWFKYKNKDFDFLQNLEIPQAKSFSKSFSTIDSSGDKVYVLMKLQCVMKDSWKIGNFPFDRQNLRLSFENSQFDSRSLIFKPDTLGKNYDPRFTLSGWKIDSFNVNVGTKVYETAFGDDSFSKPRSEYSAYRVKIGIVRDAGGLFWKMFLGMYVAFLIAYVCFYIHADGIDSRFGLSVGSLFAVIGNKYIIDSALPESTSFTLVDTLHGLTLFFIFSVISCTAYTLRLIKADKVKQAKRFDMVAAQVLLLLYILANIYFISQANNP